MKERIFRSPEYRKIIEEYFTQGLYHEAFLRFRKLYDDLHSELPSADKAILLTRIANCASDAILKQQFENHSLVQGFWEYLEKYLSIAPDALEEDQRFRGTVDEPKKRMSEALELIIRFDHSQLREKASFWVRRFAEIDAPNWHLDLPLSVLMEKIKHERTRFSRKGHIANTKAMAEVYVEVSEAVSQTHANARATVMNILADLVYFEGGEDSGEKALFWLNRCLEINPDDLFAQSRVRDIRERQIVQEQIRRFKHDTSNTKAGIEAMLKLCLRLPQASEDPLNTYLRTLQTEVRHLYGVHRFIHDEQLQIEQSDPGEIIRELILPHDRHHANFILSFPDDMPKWNTDPDYLRLAIYNLVQNALEAFQRRRVPLEQREIRITVLSDPPGMMIEDNAGGVDSDISEHMFSPYVSSKGIRRETGLGLPNARRAIEKLGGSLDFPDEQAENRARFEFYFNRRDRREGTEIAENIFFRS